MSGTFIMRRLGSDLVTDGGFENSTAGNFDDWTEGESGTSDVQVGTGEGRTGDALKLVVDSSNSACNVGQSLGTLSGEHRMEFYAKIDQAQAGNNVSVHLGANSANNKKTLTTDWVKYTIDETPISNSLTITRSDDAASRTIHVDDVVVRRLHGEITLPMPSFGIADSPALRQSMGETPGGQVFVYNRGVTVREYVFDWRAPDRGLDYAQWQALDSFFRDTAVGMLNTFEVEYSDPRKAIDGGGSGTFTIPVARFASPDLTVAEDRGATGLYSARIVLRSN